MALRISSSVTSVFYIALRISSIFSYISSIALHCYARVSSSTVAVCCFRLILLPWHTLQICANKCCDHAWVGVRIHDGSVRRTSGAGRDPVGDHVDLRRM